MHEYRISVSSPAIGFSCRISNAGAGFPFTTGILTDAHVTLIQSDKSFSLPHTGHVIRTSFRLGIIPLDRFLEKPGELFQGLHYP